MASSRPTKPLSLVQQRARQFEALASLDVKPKECNWWLSDFRNSTSDPCECEPCDNSSAVNVDEAVVDSVEVINDEELVDDVLVVDHNDDDEEDVESNEPVAEKSPTEIEQNITDEDDEAQDSPIMGKVIEAINDNVHFQRLCKTQHHTTLVSPIYEEIPVTDEEYNSFTDEDVDDSIGTEEAEEASEQEHDNEIETFDQISIENVTESKLANIVQELVENEKTYIDKLTMGIQIYVEPLYGKSLPPTLRGQMYYIFANIVQLRDFHEQTFYPSLLECNGDVLALSDTFSKYIRGGYFYSYVLYAMNKKRSERIRDIPGNKAFFVNRQNEMKDKLGINSFLMEPIQRLPKYRLLIDQLAKVLSPFLEVEKSRLAACSRAEKNVQRLLNTVNESISLNDIVDCNEINLFHQGKFLRQNEFDVHDQDTRRRYRGKVFLFERSIVFAEKFDEKVLQYRGYYPKDVTGIREYEEAKKFELFIGKSGNHQVELSSNEFGLIQTWVHLVKEMLVKSIEQEKRKIAKKTHDIRIRNGLRATDVIVRKSGANYGSASASGGSWTGSSSSSGVSSKSVSLASSAYASGISNISNISGYSTASADSDIARTTWYTDMEEQQPQPQNSNQKTTENLLTYEKHYIQLMSQFAKIELAELSDDIKFQIRAYMQVTNDILRLHREQIYPDLNKCDQDIGQICNVFRTALDYNSLQVYETYTGFVPRAYQIIFKFTGNKSFKHLMNLPVKQIKYYGNMLGNMLLELKESDQIKNIRNELKELALTDMEYSKFQKRCEANYNLNQLDPGIAEQYGLVVLAEKVTVGSAEHTLLILERGLVCVRSRLSSKTKEDKYTRRLFLIDRKCISFSTDKYPTAAKFYDICSRDVKYKVTFNSTERKTKIIVEVNKIKSTF